MNTLGNVEMLPVSRKSPTGKRVMMIVDRHPSARQQYVIVAKKHGVDVDTP